MGLLFKIFLLLCLQNAQSTNGDNGSIDIERLLVYGDVSLSIAADPTVMDHIVSICMTEQPGCEVSREEGRATIRFTQVALAKKDLLVKRLQPFESLARLQMQWTAALKQ